MTDTNNAPPVEPLPEGVQDLTGQVHFDYGRNIIGQGGMSDVIRGELNGYIVAVKIIRYIDPDQIAAYQRRANRELTVWRGLNHPNILRFIGVVNWNNYNTRPGLVSIIVPGKVLSYVRNRGLADKHAILIGIAHGLNYLHSQGVIHGDLKPPNVLVDEYGIPIICDFGLSRILDSDEFITRTTHRGTIPYIAPEILKKVEESDRVNPLELSTLQSDMYAFGLTAGAILKESDVRSIRGINRIEQAIVNDQFIYPHEIKSQSHFEILRSCWRYDPNARWLTGQVLQSLNQLTL